MSKPALNAAGDRVRHPPKRWTLVYYVQTLYYQFLKVGKCSLWILR